MAKKNYPGCPVLLEYIPWRDLDDKQLAIVKKRLTDFNLRTLARGQGRLEECYATVEAGKRRFRTLRKIRAVDEITLYSQTRSNPVASWDSRGRKKR